MSGHCAKIVGADDAKFVLADVQTAEVGQCRVVKTSQSAPSQAEMDQHDVVPQLSCRQSATAGVKIPHLREPLGLESLRTAVGESVARAAVRTGEVAEQLVVLLRSVVVEITHVAGVDTNMGGVTAVEAWTGITVAARLVFTARAVVDSVTADIHR